MIMAANRYDILWNCWFMFKSNSFLKGSFGLNTMTDGGYYDNTP
jgi:hypothetical protein